LRIMDLNLKRFLAYYGKIILMPEILMGSNSCIDVDAKFMVWTKNNTQYIITRF
jgi:hypothetical protein